MQSIIYHKPTCTTSKKVINLLQEKHIDIKMIDYYLTPISKVKLKELLTKMQISAKELVRTKEEIYKNLKLAEKNLSENEWVDLLIQYPDLMQRPIIEINDKAILARPIERVMELFK